MAEKCSNIDLSLYDGATDSIFEEGASPRFGGRYWDEVILPDERGFLLSEAMSHAVFVEVGAVQGDRTEFIVDGNAKVDFGEWQWRWDKCENK